MGGKKNERCDVLMIKSILNRKIIKICTLICVGVCIATLCNCISSSLQTYFLPASSNDTDIFDTAKIYSNTAGYYSVIKMNSNDVSVDFLEQWYFDYVMKHNYSWCMILYSDSDNMKGVYGVKNRFVKKDVFFNQDMFGEYSLISDMHSTIYYPSNDNRLLDATSI